MSLSQAAAIWLQSSRIEFPSNRIVPLESPFKEFKRASSSGKLEQRQQVYPVVKFPEQDTEEETTRERSEEEEV